MPEIEIIELGAMALLFYFAIKEFFVFLRAKKLNGAGEKNPNGTNDVKKDIALINQQLNNHMNDYNKCIGRVETLVKENSDNIGQIREAIIRIESKLK